MTESLDNNITGLMTLVNLRFPGMKSLVIYTIVTQDPPEFRFRWLRVSRVN